MTQSPPRAHASPRLIQACWLLPPCEVGVGREQLHPARPSLLPLPGHVQGVGCRDGGGHSRQGTKAGKEFPPWTRSKLSSRVTHQRCCHQLPLLNLSPIRSRTRWEEAEQRQRRTRQVKSNGLPEQCCFYRDPACEEGPPPPGTAPLDNLGWGELFFKGTGGPCTRLQLAVLKLSLFLKKNRHGHPCGVSRTQTRLPLLLG